jgi:general secretion pathway protein F
MPSFRYKAIGLSGRMEGGAIEAEDRISAVAALQAKGLYPIEARASSASRWGARFAGVKFWRSRLSSRQIGLALQDLAVLLQAGLPLDRAVDLLATDPAANSFQPVLKDVLTRVRRGASLADAFVAQGSVFSTSITTLVEAGEAGGTLDISLTRAGEMLLRASALRETIVGAMIYPMILLVVSGLSLTVILTVVLPEFKPLFEDAGAALPVPTQIVMAIGDAIGEYWLPALVVISAATWLARVALRRPAIRLAVDARWLKFPLLGRLIAKIEIARFARTLGTLLENGIALPTALSITHRGFSNRAMAQAIDGVGKSLKEGEGLAAPLEATKLFPSNTLQLIRVGEETARLGEMLERLASLLERDVQRDVQRALAVMVPLTTVGLGIMIAGIIASILVALLSLNDLAT